ncbi:MAG: hypothetical protein AABO58_00445 [Acidobacteriota bacterium]
MSEDTTSEQKATEATEIQPFLEKTPLYEPLSIRAWGISGKGPFFKEQLEKQRMYLPREISLYCDHTKCQRHMDWELYGAGTTRHSEAAGVQLHLSAGFHQIRYSCRHCAQRSVTFFLLLRQLKAPSWVIEKVGRSPRAQPILSSELLVGLGDESQELYRKAVESRNQAMGLGSLAYLRRVVENAMNALLDLMKSAVGGSDREAELLLAIDTAKLEKAFTNKVALAKAILPARLFHGGHNPLERLHDWASAGIHNRDDWECVEIFDEIRTLFELLFERLAREAAEKKLYEEKLINLTRKK